MTLVSLANVPEDQSVIHFSRLSIGLLPVRELSLKLR